MVIGALPSEIFPTVCFLHTSILVALVLPVFPFLVPNFVFRLWQSSDWSDIYMSCHPSKTSLVIERGDARCVVFVRRGRGVEGSSEILGYYAVVLLCF